MTNYADILKEATGRIVSESADAAALTLKQSWNDGVCQSRLVNASDSFVSVSEVILLEADMPFPADTPIYGEGYNKLSQYKGTVGSMEDITNLSPSFKNLEITITTLHANFLPKNWPLLCDEKYYVESLHDTLCAQVSLVH